ncbi:unnamed protein product [Mucor hiemalis]
MPAVRKFMKNVCDLSMKRLEKIPAKRNDPDTIEYRKTTVESWIATTDMDFEKNCVFLDKIGFNLKYHSSGDLENIYIINFHIENYANAQKDSSVTEDQR